MRSVASRPAAGLSFAALALLGLAGLAAAAPADRPLVLASDSWPPFTGAEGEPRIAVDLVEEALERGGFEVSARIVDWPSVTTGIRGGVFDGSAAMWKDPERESYLLFSEPYLENRLVLVGRKGSGAAAAGLDDLAGARVAVVASYSYGEELERVVAAGLVRGESDQQNLRRLLDGDVDYVLVDDLLISYLLENERAEAARHLEIASTPLVRRTLHLAIRRDLPQAAAVVETFDAEIRRMLADGTYHEILDLFWIQADVDGDGRLEMVARNDRAGAAAPVAGYSLVLPDRGRWSPTETDRYWIEGKPYEGWDSVPDRYKVPWEPETASTAARLLTLKF